MTLDDEALRRAETLITELENQTDRGAAIIGVAWVEEALQAAIESVLESDKKTWDRLFGRSGPLSSLSAKIDLARLLNICSKVIAKDLHLLREIRNDFAHTIAAKDHTGLTFKSTHIADKCFTIKCIAHEALSEPRHAFVRACAILNSDLYIHRFFRERITSRETIHARSETDA